MPTRRPRRTPREPSGGTPVSTPKIQRWIDLLAALLGRQMPATFEELARDVPAYQRVRSKTSLQRMFERDKDELRAFGVPIQTVSSSDRETVGYKLPRRDFYLPYLSLATSGGPSKPRKVDRWGYQALSALAFEPDELAAVADAAARVRDLGDPLLAGDAESAMRKLAFDLPMGTVAIPDDTHVVAERVDEQIFAALGDALRRRKVVRFDYRSIGSDSVAARAVEPYGLFFLGSHWYLAARDLDREAMRNFRLIRMSKVKVNRERSQSPDYEIPADFDLRQHARSRQAWELGDGDAAEAVVEFRAVSGAVAAAARLGEPAGNGELHRRFTVRRMDAFARWLLSFGGDAVPISPAALRDEYRRQARETLALYRSDA